MTMFSVLEAYCRLLHYNNIRVMIDDDDDDAAAARCD